MSPKRRKPEELWSVVDSYNVPVYTGTLAECDVWIDPLLGINFGNGETDFDDSDRVHPQDDGSFIVDMYVTGHPDGIGGTLSVRRTS